jgi:hypothetical protein
MIDLIDEPGPLKSEMMVAVYRPMMFKAPQYCRFFLMKMSYGSRYVEDKLWHAVSTEGQRAIAEHEIREAEYAQGLYDFARHHEPRSKSESYMDGYEAVYRYG